MKMQNPTILITYAHLLQNLKITAAEESPVLTYAEAEDMAEDYRRAWSKKEELILDGMQELMGLRFNAPLFDVALAPWTYGSAVSFPLIIDMSREPDEFIDVLTHELFHQLFSDNQIITTRNARARSRLKWNKLFGDEHSGGTLVHIAVHAALKHMYLNVHREPYRLERDIDHSKHLPEYAKAWNYVEKNDYRKIIEKLRKRYLEIASSQEYSVTG